MSTTTSTRECSFQGNARETLPQNPGVYLVKGNPDVFWFLLKGEFQFFLRPCLTEMIPVLNEPQWETKTYVFAAPPAADLLQLQPLITVAHRVFVLLVTENEKLTPEYEKVYKKLNGSVFNQIDLTRYDWWKHIDTSTLPPATLSQLKQTVHSPQLALQLMQEGDFDCDKEELLDVTVERMLQDILNQRLDSWFLERSQAYRLFGTSDLENCGFFRSTKFLCPALWMYWEIFDRHGLSLELAIQLFARWIYICTHRFKKGLSAKVYRTRTYYSFSPSPQAFECNHDTSQT